MESVLHIENLTKKYPKFTLGPLSLDIRRGRIMGLIGRNGAGKTTCLKSALGLAHPSSGSVTFFGIPYEGNESVIRARIGYAAGGTHYYKMKKLKNILAVTRMFYPTWDENMCEEYMHRFSLDTDKCIEQLSEGMKVKFLLTMALSHHADFLILDEPTSGLDPVSRDELLDIFLALAKEGVTILFSTHIISDLEKCADDITYIQSGRVLTSEPMDSFTDKYRLISVDGRETDVQKEKIIGINQSRNESTGMILASDAAFFPNKSIRTCDLETVMIHLEKNGENEQ